jgi:hypothetical protein
MTDMHWTELVKQAIELDEGSFPFGEDELTTTPRVDVTSTHVLLTCPRGHVFDAVRLPDWAGSREEARASEPRHCSGCERLHGNQAVDPWSNDPDRTTRQWTPSVAPGGQR